MYQVKALPTCQIDCDERMLFSHGDIRKRRRINCFAYLLSDEQHKILIDTGVWDLDAVNRTKKGADRWRRENGDKDIVTHLHACGIAPEEITELILTHGHYDHAGAAPQLPCAKVYVNHREWETIFSDDNPMKDELDNLRDYLRERRASGNLVLSRGTQVTDFGLTLLEMPGHTAGSQMVAAETAAGRALFTGDAVFLLANIEDNLPIGFSVDEEGSVEALAFCKKFDGICLTGHDPLCAQMTKGNQYV